jgi:hypothetical protein
MLQAPVLLTHTSMVQSLVSLHDTAVYVQPVPVSQLSSVQRSPSEQSVGREGAHVCSWSRSVSGGQGMKAGEGKGDVAVEVSVPV